MKPQAELAAAMAKIKNPARLQKFLSEIMTPAELRDLGLRWRLMQMLSRGVTQRQIAHALKISLCKITRGSKILKNRKSITSTLIKEK